jgi:hypothetical protein
MQGNLPEGIQLLEFPDSKQPGRIRRPFKGGAVQDGPLHPGATRIQRLNFSPVIIPHSLIEFPAAGKKPEGIPHRKMTDEINPHFLPVLLTVR